MTRSDRDVIAEGLRILDSLTAPPRPIYPSASMSPEGAVLFEEVVAELSKHRLVEPADRVAIENYVCAVLRLRSIQAALDAGGLFDESGAVSKLVSAAATAARVVAVLGQSIGFGRIPRAKAAGAIAASEPRATTQDPDEALTPSDDFGELLGAPRPRVTN